MSKALRYGLCVTRRSHSFTATHTQTIPACTPQLQCVTALWLVLILPGWPGWVDLGGWSHTEINVPHRELYIRTWILYWNCLDLAPEVCWRICVRISVGLARGFDSVVCYLLPLPHLQLQIYIVVLCCCSWDSCGLNNLFGALIVVPPTFTHTVVYGDSCLLMCSFVSEERIAECQGRLWCQLPSWTSKNILTIRWVIGFFIPLDT